LPEGVEIKNVELYFQDETRIGQQGSTTRIWAPKGTRPRVVRQKQFISTNIFGAICPEQDKSFAMILPDKDTPTMELFLEEFSETIPNGKHAVLVVDRAGWHKALDLKIPRNMSFVYLPPYSPELNPIEQLWRQFKHGWFSNRCFESYEEIVDISVAAWNEFTRVPGAIKKLCSRKWAILEG